MSELTLVVGATGAQGGAVARSLLQAGRRVRALTRDVSAPAAQRLQQAGATLVQGDLNDLGRLSALMVGCDSVFGVTNYWEHFGCEVQHGKNLVDAAVAARVPHLVLSTLPSPELLSRGELAVPHMEAKAEVEAYARTIVPQATFVHVAFYFENFLTWFVPRPDHDGVLSFGFPQGDTPLATVAVDDLGPIVLRIVEEPSRFQGQTVGVVGDELPCASYAETMTQVLGRPVRYTSIGRDEYAAQPFAGAADLAAMFDLNRRFIPNRAADQALTRALHPGARSFASWADTHQAQLRAVCGV